MMPQLSDRFVLECGSGFVFDSEEEAWLTTAEEVYYSIADFLERDEISDSEESRLDIDWNSMKPA